MSAPEARHVLVLLILFLVVLVLAGVVVAVLRDDQPVLQDVERDLPGDGMPVGRPMTSEDVHGLKFTVALRGYRMADVDDALTRVAHELAERDATIERLRAEATQDRATETQQSDFPPLGVGSEQTGWHAHVPPPLGADSDPTMETETTYGAGGSQP
jgi:DivIVA domain-containing protein